MFDVDRIIKTRKFIDPIPTPLPAEFPHDEEVPEGCIELNGLSDDWGYNVDIHPDIVYAKRDLRNLIMTILEPRMHDGGPIEDMFKIPSWPCVVYIQGSAFHEQEIYLQLIRHIRLAQQGFAVAIVQYRPSDMAPFPAQMQDAKTAIRFVRKHADNSITWRAMTDLINPEPASNERQRLQRTIACKQGGTAVKNDRP